MRRMPLNVDELENVCVVVGTFDFENEKLEHVSQDETYSQILNLMKKSKNSSLNYAILIVDNAFGGTYTGILNGVNIDVYSVGTNKIYNVTLYYDINTDTLEITSSEEPLISEDNVKTIFGQDITGTGNIELYRHQMTITNANDVSVVYVINASSNVVINNVEKFVAVTKANTNYTGLALYLDASSDIQPAFIRYTAGNVVVQLQNGSIAPMKSISDIVTPI